MKHLAEEEWEVSPEENIIHATMPDGLRQSFSQNTDKERAKLIEAAPKVYRYLLDILSNGYRGCGPTQDFLKNLGL